MKIFNEVTTLILVYFQAIFTDWVPSAETHFTMGWWFAAIGLTNMTVHGIYMGRQVVLACKLWYQNFKATSKWIPDKHLKQLRREQVEKEKTEERAKQKEE